MLCFLYHPSFTSSSNEKSIVSIFSSDCKITMELICSSDWYTRSWIKNPSDINNPEKIGWIPTVINIEKTLTDHISKHEKTKALLYKWVLSSGFLTAIVAMLGKYSDGFKNLLDGGK